MCEIFFLFARDGAVSDQGLQELVEAAVPAASGNSDGWGVFNDQRQVLKSSERFTGEDADTVFTQFTGSKFVVLHLRMATQGSVSLDNTHPFDIGENLLCHNGMISGNWNEYEEGPDETDSLQLLKAIEHRDGPSVDRLETVLENLSGSLSVFYYDRAGRLYYFRNRARFTFGYNLERGEVFGATKKSRLKDMYERKAFGFFPVQESDLVFRKPEEETIYRISDEGINEVGSFNQYGLSRESRSWMYAEEKQYHEPFEAWR